MKLDLPSNAGVARDNAILQAVKDGKTTMDWCALDVQYKDFEATFFVLKDGLKLDGIRLNVSASVQQKIADILGCVLPTAKIADQIHKHAEVIIKPKPRKIISTTQAMIEHSLEIDKDLNGRNGLVSTVGKHWIIDNILKSKNIGTACNYGWHMNSGLPGIKGELPVSYTEMPGVKVIQGRGTFHNLNHVDYSQICMLVARECEVNGKHMDILDLFKDPQLSYLANISGPLAIPRQPGVPDPKTIVILPNA